MYFGLSKSVDPIAPAFNGATKDANFAQASRPGVAANAAAYQASVNMPKVLADKAEIGAKLGIEKKPNDGGQGHLSGGSRLGGQIAGAVGLAALATVAPVAAAVVGAGMAVADGVRMMTSSPSNEYAGKSYFAPASSLKYGREDPKKISEAEASYTAACDGVTYTNGFSSTQINNQKPSPIRPPEFARQDAGADRREQKILEMQHGTLSKQADELAAQGAHAQRFGKENGIGMPDKVMAQGWKPPSGPAFMA